MLFLSRQPHRAEQKGFTLIETVIAILILSLSLSALLTLAAGGLFSVRYARNQIVADNLTQESLEYIRNSRDSALLQGSDWNTWLSSFNVDASGNPVDPSNPSGCFASGGCRIDPYTLGAHVQACSGTCSTIYFYPTQGFYGYQGVSYPFSGGATPVATTYVKKVAFTSYNANQTLVTVTISWRNGMTSTKTVSQSTMLTNWNQ